LLDLELFGKNLSIETDEAGLQSLYWADKMVSEIDLSGITVSELVHRFSLLNRARTRTGAKRRTRIRTAHRHQPKFSN
jgi:hypothetical protein